MINERSRRKGALARRRTAGGLRLLLVASLLATLWLVALPWIGRLPSVSDHIRHMQQKGIRPDAMFYTELE